MTLGTPVDRAGRDIVFKYTSSADEMLGGRGFACVGEWRDERGAVLAFEEEIEGIRINGGEIIPFREDGRITRFNKIVRPPKAINLLHPLMREQLAMR